MSGAMLGGEEPPLDLLAVFAHPDDEILCAAGTMALCAQAGARVALVCATRGELGPISDPALATRESLAQARERELLASCAALGVAELSFLDLPDGAVAWAAQDAGALDALAELIRTRRPRAIVSFGPDGLYGHSDHVAVGALTQRARAAASDTSRSVCSRLFFAVTTGAAVEALLRAAAQAGRPASFWGLSPSAFHAVEAEITARVDVRAALDRKLAALRCHRTQLQADHVLVQLTPQLAARVFGSEAFRCADGEPGSPLDVIVESLGSALL